MAEVSQSQGRRAAEAVRKRARQPAADALPGMPAPEVVVTQLRALQQQMGEGPHLTAKQRQAYHDLVRLTRHTVNSSISIIGASENVSQAVGHPAEEVLRKVDVSNRWTAVEDELRAMLEGVSDANLMRRYEIALIAAQAYGVGKQLARKPENAGLKTHLQEIKRLKAIGRRKKGAETAESPSPEAPAPLPELSTEPSDESQK